MAVFPLRQRPSAAYHEPPRAFGDAREKGLRAHAGCDLYAPAGTEILAIARGTVVRAPYLFYCGTDAVEIRHEFGIVRYCEIAPDCMLKTGDVVEEGQVIAHVGRLKGITLQSDMLHLELYSGSGTGHLTDPYRPPYQRRSDLQNPTSLLDSLALVQG